MDIKNLKYDSNGLIPVIIQDWKNGDVLMLAYMNEESLNKTIETGFTDFWSRSRNKLWKKGETSGNEQIVKEINYDCDNDTLLIKAEQKGVACHTGNRSCFYSELIPPSPPFDKGGVGGFVIDKIYEVILDRKRNLRES